jgi:multicomponent Na+:H+ antiporter subunit E
MDFAQRKFMRFTFSLLLLLMLFWTVNSEYHSGLLLLLELISILLVLFVAHSMKLMDEETLPLHLLTRIWPFYLWLGKEIVLASCYVLKKICQGNNALTPQFITLSLDFKGEMSKVIFVNAITLIPGTLSVKLAQESVQVHVLTQELADDLKSGVLARQIKRLEY